jgi:hypothetical protein
MAPAFHDRSPAQVEAALRALPAALRSYLEPLHPARVMDEIRRHTASTDAFAKRFFRWFDAFQIMKFAHHARDHHYGSQDIGEAAKELLMEMGMAAREVNLRGLLDQYRALR